jgi:hypothetical protein
MKKGVGSGVESGSGSGPKCQGSIIVPTRKTFEAKNTIPTKIKQLAEKRLKSTPFVLI